MRITFQPWGESMAELLDVSRRAEAAGAETLWVQELHRSATVTAAAVAGATTTAKVGTGIALGFARSPMITALESLDIDEISDGRFILGIGSGVQKLNEAWHNAQWGKPVAHIRETVRNVRQFWVSADEGSDIALEGDYEPMHIRGYERPFNQVRTDIPIYLAAMGPVMTRLAGEIGNGWISHELCSPKFLAERVLPELQAGVDKVEGKTIKDVDIVVSACCGVHPDLATARRYVAGTVGFYASVRTYADFFEFHGLGEQQQQVIDAFRAGRGADYLASEVSDEMVDALTMAGTRDQIAERIAAYDGIADAVKLSAPVHGMTPAEIRAAQDELISMIADMKADIA